MDTFRPRKRVPLRVKLLTIFSIVALFVSGLTFAIGWVGAVITWPSAPAWEASGGTIMNYFKNAFWDPAISTGKSCIGSGVIIWFDTDGKPRCKNVWDLLWPSLIKPWVIFTANKSNITQGDSVMITWWSTNSDTCIAIWWDNSWSGSILGIEWTRNVSPNTTFTYKLECTNTSGGKKVSQLVISVSGAPEIQFNSSANQIISGNTVVLNWSTANVVKCEKSGDWSWTASLNGTFTTSALMGSKNYTLTCQNSIWSISISNITIDVIDAVTPTIFLSLENNASPSVNLGESRKLVWNVSPVTSKCSASGWWSGNKTVNGSSSISPSKTTIYTLVCENNTLGTIRSSSESINIVVPSPIINTFWFSNNENYKFIGNTSKGTDIKWSSNNADKCVLKNETTGNTINNNLSTNISSYLLNFSYSTGSKYVSKIPDISEPSVKSYDYSLVCKNNTSNIVSSKENISIDVYGLQCGNRIWSKNVGWSNIHPNRFCEHLSAATGKSWSVPTVDDFIDCKQSTNSTWWWLFPKWYNHSTNGEILMYFWTSTYIGPASNSRSEYYAYYANHQSIGGFRTCYRWDDDYNWNMSTTHAWQCKNYNNVWMRTRCVLNQ